MKPLSLLLVIALGILAAPLIAIILLELLEFILSIVIVFSAVLIPLTLLSIPIVLCLMFIKWSYKKLCA